VGQSLRNLGVLLYRERRDRDAEAALREALAIYSHKLAHDSTRFADVLVALGAVQLATDRPREAEESLRRAFDTRRAKLGETHPDTAEARGFLGACLAALGKTEEGEPMILSGYQTMAASPAHVQKAKQLALEVQRLYRSRGDPKRARSLLHVKEPSRLAKNRHQPSTR
jgi:tetratricopeptide (TPR) repeat protein